MKSAWPNDVVNFAKVDLCCRLVVGTAISEFSHAKDCEIAGSEWIPAGFSSGRERVCSGGCRYFRHGKEQLEIGVRCSPPNAV